MRCDTWRVEIRRFGRMRLDGELQPGHARHGLDERRELRADLAEFRREHGERPLGLGAVLAPELRPDGAQRGEPRRQILEPRAAGDGHTVRREAAGRDELLGGIPVEDERPVGPGKSPVAVEWSHLVRLVLVVQPVAVDEAVLDRRRGHAAPARLEHQRAAPAAGLRIRHDDAGLERVDCGAGLVHRARGPGPLHGRRVFQLAPEHRPEIAAPHDRGLSNAGTIGNLSGQPSPLAPDRPRAREGPHRRQPLDRDDPRAAVGGRDGIPPPPRAEVPPRAQTDEAERVGRRVGGEGLQNRPDVGLARRDPPRARTPYGRRPRRSDDAGAPGRRAAAGA